jgi:DNA-binding response OmpR family regulator
MQAFLISQHPDEADILTVILQHAGLNLKLVPDIHQAIEELDTTPPEFVLLTLDKQSAEMVNHVRLLRGSLIAPLVVITDALTETLHIEFLESGVDLVVARPYSARLLLYQIRALLRRSNSMPLFGLPQLSLREIRLDPATRSVSVKGKGSRHLTQLEFRLLYTLMTHSDEVISSESLVEHVWGYPGEENRELVRGLVQRLRSKIESDPHNPRYVLTEPGVGYLFRAGSEAVFNGVSQI